MSSKKKEAAVTAEVDQFFNTADWHFYQSLERVRVSHQEDGSVVVAWKDGTVKKMSPAELALGFEPVKGPHKAEF